MKSLSLSLLVVRNYIDSIGIVQFLSKIFILDVVQYITLAYLMESKSNGLFSILYQKYPFLSALLSFSAAISSWEKDVFCGTGKLFTIASVGQIIASRMLTVIALATPSLVMMSLSIYLCSSDASIDFFNFAALTLSYAMLGVGLGFYVGLNAEKAINNFLHVSVWVLALGSSFSGGNGSKFGNFILPSLPSITSLEMEIGKAFFFFVIGFLAVFLGTRPRRRLYIS